MNQTVEEYRSQAVKEAEGRTESRRFLEVGSQEELRRLLRFLRKRGYIIAGGIVLGFSVAALVNFSEQRMYTASAEIEIASDQSSQFRLQAIPDLSSTGSDAEHLNTQLEILRSRTLALETIKSLHLEGNSDFCPLNSGRPWDMSSGAARNALIATFEQDLHVSRNGSTQLIDIRITTRRPELSALITNTLIDNYIEHSFHDSYSSTVKVSTWLASQLSGLKDDLSRSQAQMLEYQKSVGIVGVYPGSTDTNGGHDSGGQNIVLTHLNEINRSLAEAEVDRIIKESHLNAIKSSSPGVIDATVGSANPALQANKQLLAQLTAQYASMSESYGPRYPPLRALKAQVDQVKESLVNQESDAITSAQKQYDTAAANEINIRRKFETIQQDAFAKAQSGTQFDLARENYETKRLIYDGLQERLLEAGILAGLHSTSIHIVDSADIPVSPSRPRKSINLALGLGAGLILGCGLSLILEALDTTLKDMAEIEETLQLPLLAAIPTVEKSELHPARFREQALHRGNSGWSRIAESMRAMRSSILLSRAGAPPKIVMMTSAGPTEGKSSVATLLSVTFAIGNSRVLLIDADLRRPILHNRFGISNSKGLSTVLTGKASLHEAIVAWSELPALHILPSGPIPPLASELLGSTQMQDILKELRADYDLILIDTPPVLAVTDATIVGRLADSCVLVVRHGAVQRHVEQRCIDLLDRSGARLLGVVVNLVNFKLPGYSDYYGGNYSEYYGERKMD